MIYVNDSIIPVHKFSGGEVQASVRTSLVQNSNIVVTAHIKSSDELLALLQVKEILDKTKRLDKSRTISLHLPYVPYGRSDRAMRIEECSGLKVAARLINSMNFDKVVVHTPHSSVTEALINNITIIPPNAAIHTSIDFSQVDFVISPDAGALKDSYNIAKQINRPVIQASKNRSVTTGKITDTVVHASGDDIAKLEGSTVVIFDDILDGGYTFLKLAELLKTKYNVFKVILCITHGIFAKGLGGLDNYIDEISVVYLWNSDLRSAQSPHFTLSYQKIFE